MTVTADMAPPSTTSDAIDDQPRVIEDRPRSVGARTLDDKLTLVGSALASLAATWLIFYAWFGWRGPLGFLVLWFLLLLVFYAGVTALTQPRVIVLDRVIGSVIYAAAIIVGFALATTLIYTFFRGLDALRHTNFYTHDMAGVRPTDSLAHGGILHALIGSVIMVGIAIIVALPLGIGTAVYMTEVGKRGARVVRTVVEAMIGLPDILAGLFVYVTLLIGLGWGRSGFAAAMALAIMMTPIIARTAEVQLRVVPGGLREAGLALGATHWRSVRNVVLPTARAGLATALILGVARAVGETAPVLITSGASTFTNTNPFSEPMNSLPLYIYFALRSGQPLYVLRGFGAAAVLLTVVLALFVFTRLMARQRVGRK
jgi:phosphate transport system permease protein